MEQMDHVFNDIFNDMVIEQEESRRQAIENEVKGDRTIRSVKM